MNNGDIVKHYPSRVYKQHNQLNNSPLLRNYKVSWKWQSSNKWADITSSLKRDLQIYAGKNSCKIHRFCAVIFLDHFEVVRLHSWRIYRNEKTQMVMEGINGNRDINGNNKARRGRM